MDPTVKTVMPDSQPETLNLKRNMGNAFIRNQTKDFRVPGDVNFRVPGVVNRRKVFRVPCVVNWTFNSLNGESPEASSLFKSKKIKFLIFNLARLNKNRYVHSTIYVHCIQLLLYIVNLPNLESFPL